MLSADYYYLENKMDYRVLALLLASIGTTSAIADLKPDALDCNAKKAARNAAMDATVGVSGRCDTSKAAKNTKENVTDDVKDSVDIQRDEQKRFSDGDKKKQHSKKD
jgi:hypothetical protein